MYDFTDSSESDVDLLGDSTAHEASMESEREWNRMSDQFFNAGYREGITAGKESALQSAFDDGFAEIGAPIGREVGNLRGLAAGVLALLQSSRHLTPEVGDKSDLVMEVREIVGGLSRLQFEKLAPVDEEALAHAREHATLNKKELEVPLDMDTTGSEERELSLLRQRLGKVLVTLNLDALLESREGTI